MKWLHLSDLHIADKTDWQVFKEELLKLCQEKGPIDLVIVTGDFHNFSEVADFSKAEEFLVELMGALNLDINLDLFLVPGNHDGTSPVCKHKEANIALLKKEPLLDHSFEWNELLTQFDSYEKFVKELIPKYPYEHPARVHHRVWRDRIDFLHCNSAVVSDGKEKNNQLLDLDAFAEIARKSTHPSIVLIHNHFEDLHKQQKSRIKGIMRISTIKAYFFGDTHKQQVHMIDIKPQQNCQIPCVGCYKSAPEASDTYSAIGVIIGTWMAEKATLEGWSWKIDKSFRPDGEITGQTIEMGEPFELDNDKEKNNTQMIQEMEYQDAEEQEDKSISTSIENESWNTRKLVEFRQYIFNMSDTQRQKFNDKLPDGFRRISESETVESINQYWEEIIRCGCAEFFRKLFREVY